MILTTYQSDDGIQLGIKTERGILDVAAAVAATGVDCPASADAAFSQGTSALPALAELLSQADDAGLFTSMKRALTYAPVVPNPGKVLCIGLNYSKHAAESGYGAARVSGTL